MTIFLILFLCFVTIESGDVIVLNDNTILQAEKGAWFVDFFAPWCGHCKKLAPIWEGLATHTKGQLNVAKVDCTISVQSCMRYGVNSYPTLFLFKEGSIQEFTEPRTLTTFLVYLRNNGVLPNPSTPSTSDVVALTSANPIPILPLTTPTLPIVLRHFHSQETGEPIRLFLELSELSYQDVRYTVTEWNEVKDEGIRNNIFLFGQLPSLSVGDTHLVQVIAILRFLSNQLRGLGSKSKLSIYTQMPLTEQSLVDIMFDAISDVFREYFNLVYLPLSEFNVFRNPYVENFLPTRLGYFENFLRLNQMRLKGVGITSDWFITNTITYADIYMWHFLSLQRGLEPTCLDSFPLLSSFFISFAKEPRISAYLCSSRRPLPHGSDASFGNERNPPDPSNNPAVC